MTTSSDTSSRQVLGFQTEVRQLLHLMIHSLYGNKEIFLRELVSNASDACDRLRFEAITDWALLKDDPELRIRISADEKARTVTIADNGIGMSRDEVIANIGTIAKSGTREFLQQMTGDQAKDAHLIGQFGVGFYSSFIVADKVTVHTRRAGETAAHRDQLRNQRGRLKRFLIAIPIDCFAGSTTRGTHAKPVVPRFHIDNACRGEKVVCRLVGGCSKLRGICPPILLLRQNRERRCGGCGLFISQGSPRTIGLLGIL